MGSKSGINYEGDFFIYKKLLIGLWSKPGAAKLLGLWNNIVFGSTDTGTSKGVQDSAAGVTRGEFEELLDAFDDDAASDDYEAPAPAFPSSTIPTTVLHTPATTPSPAMPLAPTTAMPAHGADIQGYAAPAVPSTAPLASFTPTSTPVIAALEPVPATSTAAVNPGAPRVGRKTPSSAPATDRTTRAKTKSAKKR